MSNTETKFKVGQKVRFRQDGETGNMNKYMYNAYMLEPEKQYTVIDVTNNIVRIGINGLYFDVPIDCLELVPEPKPKFSDIKVGDWVEIEYDNGCKYHCQVIQSGCSIVVSFDGSEMYFDINGNELCKEENDNSFTITRIISPKEVVIDFGNGIKGMIHKSDYPDENGNVKSIWVRLSYNDPVARIWLSHLDKQTRFKVEQLLKAQEESCQ